MNKIGPAMVTINFEGGEKTLHLNTTLSYDQVVAAIFKCLDDEDISPEEVSSIHPKEIFEVFKTKI